jgi:hypothetical protein
MEMWLRTGARALMSTSLVALAHVSAGHTDRGAMRIRTSIRRTGGMGSVASRVSVDGDGQHDFDFNLGTWHTHIRRLQHPLTGSNSWLVLDGTVVVRKVWDGRGQLEEIEADGPTGHWEGLTLFLYNPQARQWSQNFANSADGMLTRSTVGEFKDGRGEFYGQDTFYGRSILVRGVWSDITATSHRYEQAFSDDGGQHWETNFSAILTRVVQ